MVLFNSKKMKRERKLLIKIKMQRVCIKILYFLPGRARLRDGRKISSMSNKLYLRVEGWKVVGPISVDKVGRFYRHIYQEDTGIPARIIIEISLISSARKLIVIRSSVVVMNELHESVEISIDSTVQGNWNMKSTFYFN